jgi:hypothetical protein
MSYGNSKYNCHSDNIWGSFPHNIHFNPQIIALAGLNMTLNDILNAFFAYEFDEEEFIVAAGDCGATDETIIGCIKTRRIEEQLNAPFYEWETDTRQ